MLGTEVDGLITGGRLIVHLRFHPNPKSLRLMAVCAVKPMRELIL